MSTDFAGNQLSTARAIGLTSDQKTYRDRVGNGDLRDIYSFRLDRSSNFRLTLKGLQENADVVLLNSNRQIIQRSTRPGRQRETIRQVLESGVYYIRVQVGQRRDTTQYSLELAATPTPGLTAMAQPQQESNDNGRFDIQFDYRFDTIGWFTPERRAALEAAAAVWERIIRDEFSTMPIGSQMKFVTDPQTGQMLSSGSLVTDYPIDDLVIFVGARDLGLSGVGLSASSILAEATSYDELSSRYRGADYEPWLGTIAFDLDTGGSPTNWFFDPSPETSNDIPADQYDFISTVVHELGHILGFGSSNAYENSLENNGFSYSFNSANAKTINGGRSIPLGVDDKGHIQDGYEFGGSGDPLMTPTTTSGIRKLPTLLDLVIFDDIGYAIDYSQAAENRSVFG